jgi:hypothetical protein
VQLIIFGGCVTVHKTKIHGCITKHAGKFGYRVRSAMMIYMQPAQTQLPSQQRIDGTRLTPAPASEKKQIPISPVKQTFVMKLHVANWKVILAAHSHKFRFTLYCTI